jgi:hypothetical protein
MGQLLETTIIYELVMMENKFVINFVQFHRKTAVIAIKHVDHFFNKVENQCLCQ